MGLRHPVREERRRKEGAYRSAKFGSDESKMKWFFFDNVESRNKLEDARSADNEEGAYTNT